MPNGERLTIHLGSFSADFKRQQDLAIPQLIILDGEGLHEQVNSDIHSTTLLTRAGVPTDGKTWVKVKGQYADPLTFLEKPALPT